MAVLPDTLCRTLLLPLPLPLPLSRLLLSLIRPLAVSSPSPSSRPRDAAQRKGAWLVRPCVPAAVASAVAVLVADASQDMGQEHQAQCVLHTYVAHRPSPATRPLSLPARQERTLGNKKKTRNAVF